MKVACLVVAFLNKSWTIHLPLVSGAQKARSPKNVKNLKLDVIVIDMVYFIFVCLLILYNSKPQNQMCDWNQKYFCFALQKC